MSRDRAIYEWVKREAQEGRIYKEIDGFYVWSPASDSGFLNEHVLTAMAKYLAARNAVWEWQIQHDPAIGQSEVTE
jgi:hypothetical protein